MATYKEQISQAMRQQGLGHCDAVELVIGQKTHVLFSSEALWLNDESKATKVMLYPSYNDWLAKEFGYGQDPRNTEAVS